MKYGVRNRIQATVKSVTKGDILSMVKFDVTDPHPMASVLSAESVEDFLLSPGDKIELVVKAIQVLPIAE